MKTAFEIIFKDVVSLLDDKLPTYLTYHNTAHTLYVLKKTIDIAAKEKVRSKDLNLLKIAALYHDIGFVDTPNEHEEIGCDITKSQLKNYGYTMDEIDVVCGMIRATKIPQNPKTHLEEIIADADLEYLATSQFWSFGDLLFKELKYYNKTLTASEWNRIQINFIKKHNYHTSFCKRYKNFRKCKNLAQLENQN